MKCESCGNVNADGANFCTSCGKRLVHAGQPAVQPGVPPNVNVQVVMPGAGGGSGGNTQRNYLPKERSDKSRTTYTILGMLLGFLGIHNFYLGRNGVAIAQLLITLLSLGSLFIVSWIWAAVDILTVEYDIDGRKLI